MEQEGHLVMEQEGHSCGTVLDTLVQSLSHQSLKDLSIIIIPRSSSDFNSDRGLYIYNYCCSTGCPWRLRNWFVA